LYRVRDKYKK